MTENVSLTTRQSKVLAALLSSGSVTKASVLSNVSERQIYRWMKEKPFIEALRGLQGQLFSLSAARLAAGLERVLNELERVIGGGRSEAVRVRACAVWLDNLFKLQELQELERRVYALEHPQEQEPLVFDYDSWIKKVRTNDDKSQT